VFDEIQTIVFFQWVCLLLNLTLFPAIHMALITLIIADFITSLHWWDQGFSHKLQMSYVDWKWRVEFSKVASQHQSLKAKLQLKNEWNEDSEEELHREHIEEIQQALAISISSVRTLSSINFQTKRDLEGGTSLHQISLAQFLIW
jgi:predicted transport protein